MPDPSYFEFLNKSIIAIREFGFDYEKYPHDWNFTISMVSNIQTFEVLAVLLLSVLMTLLRIILTKYIISPIAENLQLDKSTKRKFPESAWKLLFYSAAWIYSYYILIGSERYDFFYKPLDIWKGVVFDDEYRTTPVPTDISIMYLVQISFYVHAIYGNIKLDIWRKDSLVMIVHHVLTIFLLFVSYTMKYYKMGALVLFLHDFSDVLLEFTKLNVYMKERGGRYHPIHEYISNFGFLGFTTSWAIMRLYWFPLKVIYGTTWGVYVYHLNKDPKMFLCLNSMLIILQCMHVYWFWFAMVLLFNVLTGKSAQVEDVREFDEEEESDACKKGQEDSRTSSNVVHVHANGDATAAAAAVKKKE